MSSKITHDKIKAVIFDLDDTLISEYQFIVSGYRYMSHELSARLKRSPEEIEERLWELSRETYTHVFNRLFESYDEPYTDEELRSMILSYRAHPADISFYPDVKDTLTALKDMGILTGIISDGDPDRQRNKIRHAVDVLDSELGLHNSADYDPVRRASYWFDEIILNDEFGGAAFRKPDPKGFSEMASRLHTDPSAMIYVGDNPSKDFHISSILPYRTARIIRENGIYTEREYLDGIKETFRISTLTEIPRIIDGTFDKDRVTSS